jgi:hypothetical protein
MVDVISLRSTVVHNVTIFSWKKIANHFFSGDQYCQYDQALFSITAVFDR